MKKFLAIILALLALVLLLPVMATAADAEYDITTEGKLRDVVSAMADGDNVTVRLQNDVTFVGNLEVKAGTLTILGQGNKLTIKKDGQSCSMVISNGATVNLGTKEGAGKPENALILTSIDDTSAVINMGGSAVLNMYHGVEIRDSRSGGHAGGVQLEDQAVFNMYGGVIDNCVNWGTSVAGGVVIAGAATFNMHNGIIQNCSGYQGGAVCISPVYPIDGYISGPSSFHMYGGTIKDCHDNWLGGGAVCAYTAEPVSFIMDGGTITGCSGDGNGYGGAVFIFTTHKDAVIEINKGEISRNSGAYGGGVFVYGGTVKIADGVALHNNTATDAGDDLYNNGSGAVIVLGKTGSGLTLSSCGHTIDGWYYDGAPRWSSSECSEGAEDHMTAYEMIGVPNPAECGLKAAHGAQKNGGGVIIIEPEDPAEPEEPEDNPATGTNDFVSAAVAVAAVSLLGMAAVLRKK